MKVAKNWPRLFLLLLVSAVIVLAGCQQEERAAPLLPKGFADAQIPDVSIEGYVYANQAAPLTVPGGTLEGVTSPISVESGSLWLGPNVEAIGGAIAFAQASEAQSAADQVSKVPDVWALARGQTLYLGASAGEWAASLRDAVNRQAMVAPAEKFPNVWEDFSRFPGKPPAKPVAAGFLDLTGRLVESLSSTEVVADVVPALRAGNIRYANFVIYGQGIRELPAEIQEGFLEKLGLSMLIVGRSGYPSLLLALFFGGAMQGAGLKAEKFDNVDVYTYKTDGLAAVVARQGSHIYVALAPSQTLAGQLILSAFGKTP
ncbi:MAG: hypothetical protein HY670_08265 [Chloroflexi bacterium]|nr:hypothetical protein [Chloroflexota bacterium]